jgi:putative membrane protein
MDPQALLNEVSNLDVQAFFKSFPLSLLHAAATLVILLIGATIYALITPYKEISQIREGNGAAAVAFGGVIIGLAIPLAMALNASNSLLQIGLWGGGTALVQLLLFRITDFILVGLPARVEEGEVSAAVLLVAAKLAVAFILAAAMSG